MRARLQLKNSDPDRPSDADSTGGAVNWQTGLSAEEAARRLSRVGPNNP